MAFAATMEMVERDDALAGRGRPGSGARPAAIAGALFLHAAAGAAIMLAPAARGPEAPASMPSVELVLALGDGAVAPEPAAPSSDVASPDATSPAEAAADPVPPPPATAAPLPEPAPAEPPTPVAASPLPDPAPAEPPTPVAASPLPDPAPAEPPRRTRAAEAAPAPRPAAPPRRPARDGAAGPATAARGEGEAPLPARAPAAEAPSVAPGPPLITAPRFRRPPSPPAYPARAIELDLAGTVVVRALLDPSGDPTETLVLRSSGHAILDSAALAAVRRWAFEPASRDGQRIAAWVEVPVHFRLR
ncbi:energy transducer TonB [Falsiroseomonas ponticola]|uniref:energy transducer TonB n=1 Tax=Falsiroseomonas ponticola TaxID=2786951 RepID=UPI0019333650|nr:energy transducer TonB [Roseomonas ponticola]